MLDFLFGFLLAYEPIIAVTIFAIIIVIIINIFYKVLIKQNEAKQLKENLKELNKRMKEEQKAGNTEKAKELMSESMKENSRLMRMTMKPMIVSFIIVIVFLPWLHTVYGDLSVPIVNNTGNLTISNNAFQIIKSDNNVKINELNIDCSMPCYQNITDFNWKISKEDDNVKFARVIAALPVPLPIFGAYLGWLGWYILVSIPAMIVSRKFMKIYV